MLPDSAHNASGCSAHCGASDEGLPGSQRTVRSLPDSAPRPPDSARNASGLSAQPEPPTRTPGLGLCAESGGIAR
eukprot:2673230-Alexandrium_andersonii.AAC.1